MDGSPHRTSGDLAPTYRGFMDIGSRKAIAITRWDHPAPKGRVVLSHGYGEHAERYRHTARWLNECGWAVSGMDHRGFGRSGGRRGDASGIRAFVEDLAFFLRHERHYDARQSGGRAAADGDPDIPAFPQVLLGHSFGGLVAVLDLLWHPDTLDGLILTSPVVALRPMGFWMRVLQRAMFLLAAHKTLDLPTDKGAVCSDPEFVQKYWEDPLCHRRASAAFAQAIAEGRREILPFGHELDRPILLLESGDDVLVDPGGSEELWSAVRPGILERHRLDGFKHEILHDLRRSEAQALAGAWLDRLLAQWRGNPTTLADMSVTETKESR